MDRERERERERKRSEKEEISEFAMTPIPPIFSKNISLRILKGLEGLRSKFNDSEKEVILKRDR